MSFASIEMMSTPRLSGTGDIKFSLMKKTPFSDQRINSGILYIRARVRVCACALLRAIN